jgi:Cys-rich protein (TIGR01571 family)
LLHATNTKRLNSKESLANAGLALADFALSESGRENQSDGAALANPTVEGETQDSVSAEHAQPKSAQSGTESSVDEEHGVAKTQDNLAVEASTARKQELEAVALEKSLDSEDNRVAEDPISQLVGDQPERAVVEDGNEMEQEMDDIILDVEEIERIGGKVLHKIERFWGEEGFRHVVLNFAVYFAGVFISLGLYATCFRHRDVKAEQEFRYGACECFGDGRVCACGMCCPAIRWADTISDEKGGFLDFSTALLVMTGLGILCLAPYAGAVAWIGIVVVGVYYRQKIRVRYGLEADTVQSYMEDILMWCCCAWCAICQEARQAMHSQSWPRAPNSFRAAIR